MYVIIHYHDRSRQFFNLYFLYGMKALKCSPFGFYINYVNHPQFNNNCVNINNSLSYSHRQSYRQAPSLKNVNYFRKF